VELGEPGRSGIAARFGNSLKSAASVQVGAPVRGGWRPIKGFTQGKGATLKYPGDPPLHPIALWHLRDEMIVVYRYGLVAIFDTKAGTFEVARMD